jgi:serine/threonine-protein kinase
VLAKVDRILAPLTWVIAGLVVLLLFVGPSLIGADKDTSGSAAQQTAAPSGKAVFASAGCGGCHTLAAAGSSGTTGPNLDDAKPSAQRVQQIVTSGEGGMPSFGSRLSSAEIKAVAAFVSGTEAAATATATATPAAGDQPTVAKTIRAGRGPDGITVDDEEAVVWVADATAGRLVRIDADDNTLGTPLPAGRQPDNPLVADDGILWVVSSGDDAVLRIEEDGTAKRIPVGRAPESLALTDEFVWVTNAGDGTVTRIERDSGQVSGSPIKVGTRPLDIAAGENTVWVTNFGDDSVTRLDAQSGQPQGDAIPVGHHPRGIAVGDAVWVSNAGDGTVTRIDAGSGKIGGQPITVGKDPREIAIGEGFVWVANAGDDTVTRIDPASGKVAGGPIAVGDDPIGIAVGAGAVWTANFRAGTVTRIEP